MEGTNFRIMFICLMFVKCACFVLHSTCVRFDLVNSPVSSSSTPGKLKICNCLPFGSYFWVSLKHQNIYQIYGLVWTPKKTRSNRITEILFSCSFILTCLMCSIRTSQSLFSVQGIWDEHFWMFWCVRCYLFCFLDTNCSYSLLYFVFLVVYLSIIMCC